MLPDTLHGSLSWEPDVQLVLHMSINVATKMDVVVQQGA